MALSGRMDDMGVFNRVQSVLRRWAHRRGILWSPSHAFLGVPFGKHGVRLLPTNKRHAAMVVQSAEAHHEAMRRFFSSGD